MNTHGKFRRDLLPPALVYYGKEGVKLIGRGDWRSALCPFHDDHNPSLGVNIRSGRFLCHNGRGYVPGAPVFTSGEPLYRLDLLASHSTETVVICEGEKCVDALLKSGVLATTSGGATSAGRANWKPLAGRDVLIWPDADEPGEQYATEVAEALKRLGCYIRVIETSRLQLRKGEDAFDWLARHPNATRDDVLRLAAVDGIDAAVLHAVRRWVNARCCRDPRVMGAVRLLYREFCETDGAKRVLTPDEFLAGLLALGVEVETGFAKGLALMEDLDPMLTG